jgi:hypothetical protein
MENTFCCGTANPVGDVGFIALSMGKGALTTVLVRYLDAAGHISSVRQTPALGMD